jgi:uncharacterized protein YutE (UPF0331/DUF86 family)
MMAPVQEKVVVAKVAAVREMMSAARALPLASLDSFLEDPRTRAAAESYLRRALEALLDLGRHVLARAFSDPVVEYREIGRKLGHRGVLEPARAELLIHMGRYRNRHDEVTPEELYRILTERAVDVEVLVEDLLAWLRAHPELVTRSL